MQVVTIFLAFKTRNVDVKGLNESKEVRALCVTTTPLTVIVAILRGTFSDYLNVVGASYSLGISTSTAVILIFIFIPKVSWASARGFIGGYCGIYDPNFLSSEKPLSCLYCSTACTSYVSSLASLPDFFQGFVACTCCIQHAINLGRSLRRGYMYSLPTANQFQYTMAYLFGTGLDRYQHKWEKRVAKT